MNDWSRELKPGFELYCEVRFGGGFVTKIKKVLPSGRYRLESGGMIDQNGHCRCGDTWCGHQFRPWDDETKHKVAVGKARQSLRDFKWSTLSDDAVLEVLALVKSRKPLP